MARGGSDDLRQRRQALKRPGPLFYIAFLPVRQLQDPMENPHGQLLFADRAEIACRFRLPGT